MLICGSLAFFNYQMVSMGRWKFSTDFQLLFRFLKALLFLAFMSVMTVLFVVFGLTISDLFACLLAFLPSGWAILLVRFKLQNTKYYDYFATEIFVPI